MRRLHLIEWHEQPWMPEILKGLFRDLLAWIQHATGVYANAVPVARRWLDSTGAEGYLDLCSGSGGPAVTLAEALAADGRRPKVRFSDLYPQRARYAEHERQWPEHFSHEPEPFDATASGGVKAVLRARTVLSAFHHFPPDLARAVMADAAANADGLCVMEPFRRDWLHLLMIPQSALLTILFPLLGGSPLKTRLAAVLFLPVLLAIMAFDGAVSVLRCHNPDELLALAADPRCAAFEWEAGHWPHMGILKGTYLIGVRKPIRDFERTGS